MFGFGYALTCLAFLPYLMNVKIALPMIAIQCPIYTGFMLYGLRRHMTARLALPLIVGLVLGLPIGVYLLGILSEGTIRKLLGSFILFYSLWSLYKVSAATSLRNKVWGLFVGFLSGVVGGAILAAGPIVVAYLNLCGLSKEEFKTTFLIWAMTLACLLIPFYALSNILTYQAFLWGMISMPFAGLGVFLGVKFFKRVKEQLFYRLILILLALSGIRLLFS
ncbi:MAG: sulfite exporter TauE/SafE family protein [Deltaproteobacteria bacterium]|nr:MAG: sulfite exporter TauE/SafE family protein [Deltaproteobacteria bacterium]